MKLHQKYFIPFMGIGAIITMIFIVYASFNFKTKQEENFRTNITEYTTLLTDAHPSIYSSDSLRLSAFYGKKVIVLFWASWSELSADIMNELDLLADDKSFAVIAAVVKDATETVELVIPNHNFIYVDGTKLFNHLKVPGIPSYFVLDEQGLFKQSFVGYHKKATQNVISLF